MVETTSCLTCPAALRQVNGVGVDVGGTGLGGKVAATVGVGGVTVGVEITLFGVEQAESEMRSGMQVILRIA